MAPLNATAAADRRRGIRLILVVGLLGLVGSGLFFVLRGGHNADEGFYLNVSRLVSDGLRPYADFGFTQTPLVPYANLPWLHLFGFDLLGLRLAGLAWTALTIALGVVILARTGPTAAGAFAWLLLLAPGWMTFAVKGKTYAFAGFAVMLGTLAVCSPWTVTKRWTIFLLAAIAGVSARLPLAAFFATAGIGLLIQTPGWKHRAAAVLATIALAALTIQGIAHGAWEQTWFWTVDFHRNVGYDRSWSARLAEFFALGPAIWLGLGLAIHAAWRSRDDGDHLLMIALLVAIAANLGRRTTYGEYVAPFVPVAALLVAPRLAVLLQALKPMRRNVAIAGLGLSALILPPKPSWTTIDNAAAAANVLRELVQPGAFVVASMPEIPVASGHRTYPELAMGKFASTEDFPREVAMQMHLAPPDVLLGLVRDERTQAVVLSAHWVWNFRWSVPSIRWLSQAAHDEIFAALDARFAIFYTNEDFVVMLPKEPAAIAPTEPATPSAPADASP